MPFDIFTHTVVMTVPVGKTIAVIKNHLVLKASPPENTSSKHRI